MDSRDSELLKGPLMSAVSVRPERRRDVMSEG